MVDYFNPSSRINLPVKESTYHCSPSIYCSCGFMMSYDPLTDTLRCPKCGLRCTPQVLCSLMRRKFK
jgi:hypothetical protein